MSADGPQKISKGKLRWLSGQLDDWEKEGLIDGAVANRLRSRYALEDGGRPVAQILLACIGALLIASGIILLLAHNWEALPRTVRGALCFVLLISGHLLSGWALYRAPESVAWRESAAVFLGMAIAACIALIGQTYHIPGNLESFLLIWGLLLLPIPFLLRSGYQFILMQSVWAVWTVYAGNGWSAGLLYLGVIVLSYGYICLVSCGRQRRLLHWGMALVLCLTFPASWPMEMEGGWMLVFGFLFALYIIGNGVGTPFGQGWRRLPYAAVGSVGQFVLMLILSYRGAWSQVHPSAMEQVHWIVLGIIAAVLMAFRWQRDLLWQFKAAGIWLIVLSYILMLSGMRETGSLLISGYILVWSVLLMREGFLSGKLSTFNIGYLQLTLLLLLRFFDENIGLVPRALMFIGLGVAFIWIQCRIGKRLLSIREREQRQTWQERNPLPEGYCRRIEGLRARIGGILQFPSVVILIFGGMVLAQYAVPGKMLIDREWTLRNGRTLRFETAPVDPYDAFRGRYVALDFAMHREQFDQTVVADGLELESGYPGSQVIAVFEPGANGMAQLVSLQAELPSGAEAWLEVRARLGFDGIVWVRLPFDRYYMNEAVAPVAERLFQDRMRNRREDLMETDTQTLSYVEVRIRKGQGVLAGLIVDGGPIEEWVRQHAQ